jgi:hypothetical protein
MSEMRITLSNGVELGFTQMLVLAEKARELGHSHWHLNECGCCVTIHGRDCAYVIGPDGGADFFPERGCECPPETEGPTLVPEGEGEL